MQETVNVGLAVSSEVYDGPGSSCEYTDANFEYIQFECAGESCQIGAFVSSVDTNLCQVGFQEMIDHVELLNIMCR